MFPHLRTIVTLVLRVWLVCNSTMRVLHAPVAADSRYVLTSMHSPMVRKRAELQIRQLTLPDTPKTRPSLTTWWKQPGQHMSRLGGLTSHIDLQISHFQGYHAQHRTTLIHTWGFDKLVTLCLSRLLPRTTNKLPRHETNSLDTGQSILTLVNHFCLQAGSKFRGLTYCPRPTKSIWHPTWHLKTRVNPPCQLCYRSADAWPLAVGLPNQQVISNLLIFEFIWIYYLLAGINLSISPHIIYKVWLSSAFIYISNVYL